MASSAGFVHGVAFLPQELGGAQERTRRFLPAHNGAPLVVELRQVAVRVDDLLVMLAEENLTRRAYARAHSASRCRLPLPRPLQAQSPLRGLFPSAGGIPGEQRHVNVLVTPSALKRSSSSC